MSPELDDSGFQLAYGSYEDALACIGVATPVRVGDVPVDLSLIRHFAAMVHDGNASFWDEDFAKRQWGEVIAPPAMLMTFVIPLRWTPWGDRTPPLMARGVPLPGRTIVNVENSTEYFEPIRRGDQLSVAEELVDISAEKRTSLGTGHFVTTRSTYRRQDGTTVAEMTNVLFRFSPEGDG